MFNDTIKNELKRVTQIASVIHPEYYKKYFSRKDNPVFCNSLQREIDFFTESEIEYMVSFAKKLFPFNNDSFAYTSQNDDLGGLLWIIPDTPEADKKLIFDAISLDDRQQPVLFINSDFKLQNYVNEKWLDCLNPYGKFGQFISEKIGTCPANGFKRKSARVIEGNFRLVNVYNNSEIIDVIG